MQIASRQGIWSDYHGKGTVLIVRAGEGMMTARLGFGKLAEGSSLVSVEWGDGTSDAFPDLCERFHTYARPGCYTVRISDDLRSFGFEKTVWDGFETYRLMLLELVQLGEKVTEIGGYGFNNCQNMRGTMNFRNVTSMGDYALGSVIGVTDFIFPELRHLGERVFYIGPSARQIHADKVESIDSSFWEYYGWGLDDLYIRGKTCAEIRAMRWFPFLAPPSARFHGSDGVLLGDGTFIRG